MHPAVLLGAFAIQTTTGLDLWRARAHCDDCALPDADDSARERAALALKLRFESVVFDSALTVELNPSALHTAEDDSACATVPDPVGDPRRAVCRPINVIVCFRVDMSNLPASTFADSPPPFGRRPAKYGSPTGHLHHYTSLRVSLSWPPCQSTFEMCIIVLIRDFCTDFGSMS